MHRANAQCVNSVPLYVRKLHFMYELVRTSSKYRWSIYRTSGKCRWSIYRTSRKRRGTLRVVHRSGTEFTHSAMSAWRNHVSYVTQYTLLKMIIIGDHW